MIKLIKYILLLFTIITYSQQHILIGDLQTYFLAILSIYTKKVYEDKREYAVKALLGKKR